VSQLGISTQPASPFRRGFILGGLTRLLLAYYDGPQKTTFYYRSSKSATGQTGLISRLLLIDCSHYLHVDMV